MPENGATVRTELAHYPHEQMSRSARPPDVRNGYAFPNRSLLTRGGCASDWSFEA